MPFRRRFRPRAYRPRAKRTRRMPLVTARRYTPYQYRTKGNYASQAGISHQVMYFHSTGFVTNGGTGTVSDSIDASSVTTTSGQFSIVKDIWEEYKVLAVYAKWIPLNLGKDEARGAICTYVSASSDLSFPATIGAIAEKPSVHVVNPNKQHRRYMLRPRRFLNWGDAQDPGTTPDAWNVGGLYLFGTGAANSAVQWYAKYTWKVMFRNRLG